MQWASTGDFFAMGGYAFYVWGSYAVTAVAIAIEITLLVNRGRKARAALRDGGTE